ncbi:MAG: hypothetical protein ACT6QU_14680 [Aliihoeflea sp.]|uniref:hypothetical protein n=1 Tax=Aliihoeflea sp. TaxID=2608088 RepID=UPI0040336C0E
MSNTEPPESELKRLAAEGRQIDAKIAAALAALPTAPADPAALLDCRKSVRPAKIGSRR